MADPPINTVMSLIKKGLTHEQIRENLESQGYHPSQILEALNQASMKQSVMGSNENNSEMQESMLGSEDIPVPSPSEPEQELQPEYIPHQSSLENVHELVESIIDERWQEVVASVGDITIWKGRVEDDLSAIKQEILRMQERIDRLQTSIIGKVEEYNKGILDVSSEMKALEKVFDKIIGPLTNNVKELSRITEDFKKKS